MVIGKAPRLGAVKNEVVSLDYHPSICHNLSSCLSAMLLGEKSLIPAFPWGGKGLDYTAKVLVFLGAT